MKLQNKVAVVTGGNSGIGLAIAREFKSNGPKLVIFGRSRQTVDQAAQSLGGDSFAVQGDVRRIDDVDRLFEQTVKAFGEIDVLVAEWHQVRDGRIFHAQSAFDGRPCAAMFAGDVTHATD